MYGVATGSLRVFRPVQTGLTSYFSPSYFLCFFLCFFSVHQHPNTPTQIDAWVMLVLCNVLGVLHNVSAILCNVQGVLRNVFGVLRDVLGLLCNDLGV